MIYEILGLQVYLIIPLVILLRVLSFVVDKRPLGVVNERKVDGILADTNESAQRRSDEKWSKMDSRKQACSTTTGRRKK